MKENWEATEERTSIVKCEETPLECCGRPACANPMERSPWGGSPCVTVRYKLSNTFG